MTTFKNSLKDISWLKMEDIQSDGSYLVRRWYSSILVIQSFRGADHDTDHYVVVTKVTDRLSVSKPDM
jgi:hypothetical protein